MTNNTVLCYLLDGVTHRHNDAKIVQNVEFFIRFSKNDYYNIVRYYLYIAFSVLFMKGLITFLA